MAKYFLDNKPLDNGDREVHKFGCLLMPLPRDSHYLGDLDSTQESIKEAKKHHKKVVACPYCTFPWHSGQKKSVIEGRR